MPAREIHEPPPVKIPGASRFLQEAFTSSCHYHSGFDLVESRQAKEALAKITETILIKELYDHFSASLRTLRLCVWKVSLMETSISTQRRRVRKDAEGRLLQEALKRIGQLLTFVCGL